MSEWLWVCMHVKLKPFITFIKGTLNFFYRRFLMMKNNNYRPSRLCEYNIHRMYTHSFNNIFEEPTRVHDNKRVIFWWFLFFNFFCYNNIKEQGKVKRLAVFRLLVVMKTLCHPKSIIQHFMVICCFITSQLWLYIPPSIHTNKFIHTKPMMMKI